MLFRSMCVHFQGSVQWPYAAITTRASFKVATRPELNWLARLGALLPHFSGPHAHPPYRKSGAIFWAGDGSAERIDDPIHDRLCRLRLEIVRRQTSDRRETYWIAVSPALPELPRRPEMKISHITDESSEGSTDFCKQLMNANG